MNILTNQQNDALFQGGITEIYIRGFKSLRDETRIAIKPLTIFAGANSSGKSSAMQPLLLMKQTLESTFDPGCLLLNGPEIAFTDVEQLISAFPQTRNKFSIGISVGHSLSFMSTLTYIKSTGIMDVTSTIYEFDGKRIELKRRMKTREISKIAESLHLSINDLTDLWHVERQYYKLYLQGPGSRYLPVDDLSIPPSEKSDALFYNVDKLIRVSGARGNPERTYKRTSSTNYFGKFENYVASIIHDWQTDQDYRTFELARYLDLLGFANSITTEAINDTEFQILVRNKNTNGDRKKGFNIADVGFGVSQVLPVLVALLSARPSQVVYLEQPEIHLHPKAQVKLASILAEAANRGVRVVVETHSSLLLTALQTCVAEEHIEPKNVVLHWFEQDNEGITQIRTAEVDGVGAFGDWPEDFSEVELSTESRYLDAVEQKIIESI